MEVLAQVFASLEEEDKDTLDWSIMVAAYETLRHSPTSKLLPVYSILSKKNLPEIF